MISNPLIVFMHGKWSRPNTYIFSSLERLLISQNYSIKKLDMPWSRNRNYDQSYHDALKELSEQINHYRTQGFKKIILLGHSIGANACFAYQAEYNNADAIVAITPGHRPETLVGDSKWQQWLRISKKNIDGNQSEQLITFEDINSGFKKTVNTTSKIFYSYYSPTGLGNMPLSVSKIKRKIPVLLIEGRKDKVRLGPEYIYFRLPDHLGNSYQLIESDHIDCMKVSKELILNWLNGLKI